MVESETLYNGGAAVATEVTVGAMDSRILVLKTDDSGVAAPARRAAPSGAVPSGKGCIMREVFGKYGP